MSIITASDLATHLGIDDNTDLALLTAAAASACRNVQGWCGREFDIVTGSTSATARYFVVRDVREVLIDDCTTITAVATDSADVATWATSLATTDYYALPIDGISPTGRSGWPYTAIACRSGYRFPTENVTIPALKVTAKWGWSALPDDVKTATLMVGAELYRKGGSTEMFTADGQFIPIRRNALVRDLLADYRGWRSAPAVG